MILVGTPPILILSVKSRGGGGGGGGGGLINGQNPLSVTKVICRQSLTPKTNRRSFCIILKLSHALDGLFSVLFRLHSRKHKCTF